MIGEVLSQVFHDVQVYRDVCYEWEEIIAEYFDVPVREVVINAVNKNKKGKDATLKNIIAKVKHKLSQTFPFLLAVRNKLRKSKRLSQNIRQPLSLCFLMWPHESRICDNANCLPIFLDVWQKLGDIDYVAGRTKNMQIFYVTSRDVYNAILNIQPSSRVKYIPLSVSDKYYSPDFTKYRNKTIDVIQIGRVNYVLHEYMLRYIQNHQNIEIEYIYSDTGRSAGGYISTKRGHIGKILDRAEFINMLSCAKVSLVSSPGYENSKDYAEGIHFVTPRFYESAILGCALIGRYPENQEFTELNMPRYCPNITSYEQFCECLERALAQTPEELYAQNHDFIINSLTSKRAEQIKCDLEELEHE